MHNYTEARMCLLQTIDQFLLFPDQWNKKILGFLCCRDLWTLKLKNFVSKDFQFEDFQFEDFQFEDNQFEDNQFEDF